MFSPFEPFEDSYILVLNIFEIFEIDLTLLGIVVICYCLFTRYSVYNKLFDTILILDIEYPETLYYEEEIFLMDLMHTRGLLVYPVYMSITEILGFANGISNICDSFSPTVTAILPFFLGSCVNVYLFFLNFYLNGFMILRLFVKNDLNIFLSFLIAFIEILSYCLRLISLSIRLFANMIAGHILVHLLTMFGFICANAIGVSTVFGQFIFILLILLMSIVECIIASLQAYVFVTLLCIYTKDIVEVSH